MPNWVCNHLTIHGENAVEIMRSYLTENPEADFNYDFDFNKIIAMPEELKIICGSITSDCAKLFVNSLSEDSDDYIKYARLYSKAYERDFVLSEQEQEKFLERALSYRDYPDKKLLFANKDEVYAYGKRSLDNYEKYGAKDWYDWCCNNWGTKWNACHTQINDMEKADIYFDTAWSAVSGLIEKIAQAHPECKFEYEFAEEDAGYNAGYLIFENGEVTSGDYHPNESKEAYETYFSLWGRDDEFKFNAQKGTYEYIDTEAMQ